MTDETTEIFVHMDCQNDKPVFLGTLYAVNVRGRASCAFSFDDEWLCNAKTKFMLDPDLSFYRGRQYVPPDKAIFGMFADSCPDRWGRTLMDRREAILAREENRKPKKLTEFDYLLGVHDESRMGALRFSLEMCGPYLAHDEMLAAPPWTTLRQLENASIAFEHGDGLDKKWLNQLIAPGSSLGGARPKACVQNPDGSLWIAKFPSRHDDYDCGMWEMVTHDLATMCGLNVPDAQCMRFSDNGSTFLSRRFDRNKSGRIHFASAMTLLGKRDGDAGTSYLDLASFIKADGASPKEDLRELWKRVVFSMAVSNTDDHLRNHGFILTEAGWRLSPMYDVNPSIYGDCLSLNVTETDSSIDYSLAVEVAQYYGISQTDAANIIKSIDETVKNNWERIAKKYGANRASIERMRPAFSI